MTKEEILQKCSQKLVGIADQVLTGDRKDAMKEFGLSAYTISRYLNGFGKDAHLGTRLYEFLSTAIEKREAVLMA